jgi:hypothetical protein
MMALILDADTGLARRRDDVGGLAADDKFTISSVTSSGMARQVDFASTGIPPGQPRWRR